MIRALSGIFGIYHYGGEYAFLNQICQFLGPPLGGIFEKIQSTEMLTN